MAYKRPESTIYQIRRKKLPGYGDTGIITSGVRDKRLADRMERLLEEIAERALVEPRWKRLIDAVVTRQLSMPDLMRSKAERRLDALLVTLNDPLLTDAIAALPPDTDKGTRIGLEQIAAHFGAKARLSAVTEARAITAMCLKLEQDGQKRNSVRRQAYRAASKLIRFHLGRSERDRIFSDVHFSAEDDSRDVHLSTKDISRLLDKAADAHAELPAILLTALLTGADRGVLLAGEAHSGRQMRGLLRRDVEIFQETEEGSEPIYYGRLTLLHDTKAKGRKRTVAIGDRLARQLVILCRGKDPDAPVFSVAYRDLDFFWRKARKAAKLEHVRFKDLRHQYAQYAERAGIPLSVLSSSMGHDGEEMTRRYTRHTAAMSRDQVSALEGAMLAA